MRQNNCSYSDNRNDVITFTELRVELRFIAQVRGGGEGGGGRGRGWGAGKGVGDGTIAGGGERKSATRRGAETGQWVTGRTCD